MLALCLMLLATYYAQNYAGIMLDALATYYAQNYAGIIGWSLAVALYSYLIGRNLRDYFQDT